MDNYIILNGKKIPLTDEQIKLIQPDMQEKVRRTAKAENADIICCSRKKTILPLKITANYATAHIIIL